MKKFVLLPESKYRQLSECAQTRSVNNTASSILQAVQRPEQREMIKKYDLAQSVFNDASKPSDVKMSEYKEAMNDFSVLRDRVKDVRAPSPPLKKVTDNDRVVDDAVNLMPTTLQSNARKLLDRIKDDKRISWTPNGEVSIRGKRLPGTNIADLVGDVIRPTKTAMPERERFLDALAETNTPETLIRNKTALDQYRKVKSKGIAKSGPPGIRQLYGDDEVSSTTRDLDDDDERGVMTPATKKKRKYKAHKASAINWTTT